MSERLTLEVAAEEDGERLDVVLGGRAEFGSRAEAQRLIDAGRVTVGGRVRPKRHRLRAGDRIEAALADERPPDAAIAVPYRVAYEDEHLLVVDKPPGVVVHPGAGHAAGTLAQALAAERGAAGGDPERPGIVHRLDRDTSGLLVVARSEAAHAALSALIRRREVAREYLALVEGCPDALEGTIEAPLGRDAGDPTRVSLRSPRARAARTRFRRREALARTALLEVALDTGRTHQIRVHLAAIGHPVCGDRRYGGAGAGRRLGLDRQFLHAARVALAHPLTGGTVEVCSPLPGDLERALAAARGEGPAA